MNKIEGPIIRDVLAPIWLSKPETARRVRQRIGAVLDWSYVKGYRKSEAPMRSLSKGLLRQPRKDGHFAAMPYADVPALVARLRERVSVGWLAPEALILTAARSGEIRGATCIYLRAGSLRTSTRANLPAPQCSTGSQVPAAHAVSFVLGAERTAPRFWTEAGHRRKVRRFVELMVRDLKCGALFAGIGGFCAGFGRAGMPTSWAVELDSHASGTYRHNFPHVRLLEKSVTDVQVDADQLDPVDIVHAGFPCQSFSQAGERKGFDDPRGRLFFEIIRVIEGFKDRRPAVLVLENAPFLQYGEGGAWFLELQKAIQRAGYWFRPENSRELSAYDLTALPQQRTRLFMVAFSMTHFRSGRFAFPEAPHPALKDLRAYIDFDGHVDDAYYLPKDNRYFDMISTAVRDRNCIYQLRKYQVRSKEPGVCPTLTANMGQGGHNVPFIMNGNGLRKLTEVECLRLQGFPDEFMFPDDVPRAKRYTQVGNAVAVPVAELIAKQIQAKVERELN